jgi:PAS domain S-box-containing protein
VDLASPAQSRNREESTTGSDPIAALLENAPIVVYLAGAGGELRYVNPQIEALLGYPAESWLGVSFSDRVDELLHPDDRWVLAEWEVVDREAGTWTGEYRLAHASGHYVWVLDRHSFVAGTGGHPFEQGIVLDITDRRRAEEAQQELEARFAHLTETSPAAVYTVSGIDPPVLTYFSPQVEAILGYPVEYWLGPGALARWAEHVHRDDAHLVAGRRDQPTGVVYGREYRMRHADGHWVWVNDQSRLVVVDGVQIDHGTLVDVTHRREAEAKREEAERRYRELIESSPNAFYRASTQDGREIVYMGPQIEQITGWPIESWLGVEGIARWQERMHPEDWAELEPVWNAVDAERGSWEGEYRLRRADGTYAWVLDISAYVTDSGGLPLEQGVLVDISDRKHAERERELAELRYRELVETSPNVTYTAVIEEDGTRSLVYVSPQIEALVGYPADSWLGPDQTRVWSSRMHHDDLGVLPGWEHAVARREQWSAEYRLVRGDGRAVWVLDSSQFVASPAGKAIQQGTLVDITERKLQESLFRLYVETAPIVAYRCILGAESEVVYMSPQIEDMFGYPAGSWLGPDHTGRWAERMHPDDRWLIVEWQQRDREGASWSGEYRLRHADGHYLTVYDSYANSNDLAGGFIQQGFLMDVTPRIEAEAELRAADRRYRELTETVPALLQSCTPDGTLLLVNDAWRRSLGFGSEDPLPRSMLDVVHEGDRDHCAAIMERCAVGERVGGIDLRLIGVDGRVVAVRGTASPRTENGTVVAINAVLENVTEQVRSERRLRESLDGLEDGLWMLSLDPPQLTYTNPAMARIFGCEGVDGTYGGAFDEHDRLVHPDDRRRKNLAFERWVSSRGAEPYELEFRVARPDGLVRWIAERGVPIRDERGDVIALQGFTRDVTEQRLADQAVSGWVHDAIVVLDERGSVVSWNAGAEHMFGWSAAEMIGSDLTRVIPGRLREPHTSRIAALAEGAAPVALDRNREVAALRRDGTEFSASLVVTRWDSGGRSFYTGVVHDMTERVERERELAAARDEIQHLSEIRQELVHMLVHDLRGPLTGIRLGVDMLALDVGVGERGREIAAQVVAGADRLEQLVDDVLLTARLESGSVELDLRRESLRALVDEALLMLGRSAVGPIELAESEWPDVVVDRGLIVRVVANLVSNAYKFSPPGAAVSLAAIELADDRVEVRVADRGPGVRDDLKEAIFDRFQVAHHPDRSVRQTGLTFCRLAIEAHGGTIEVRDRERGGAVFAFTLPLAGASG